MNTTRIQTKNLNLVAQTPEDVRAQIKAMDAEQREALSADWLVRVRDATEMDAWTLGFAAMHQSSGAVVGNCGFKGPPGADGVVEIAYMIMPAHQGKGYATEAADALVDYAFSSGRVRVVRAHTLPEANASTRVLSKCGFRRIGEVMDSEDGLIWRWEKSNDGL
jgi:RimJ/RimL family protein N-acetyltransferase